ncbi:hypothetical protein [Dysgonomonas sp. BGC7]|uniref:hypothetical protein n=1 Tax=Dysgonomonas sp. BGC7 TaxID=1658008 RepID=UPI000682FB7C|nr:hypothetical protein [Dysgonomonas sp. BGC7]MBD8387710.1 hypothetical protein [Dysgonomonas sp. BGC7]
MSIFTIFVIIAIIVKIVQYFLKGNEESQSSDDRWQSHHTTLAESSDDEGYDSEYIESDFDFYTFEVYPEEEEFSFTTDDETYDFSYSALKDFSVKTTNDAVISITLITNIPDKSQVTIECFNRVKVFAQLPSHNRNIADLNRIYEVERRKVERIKEVLNEILYQNNPSSHINEEEGKKEETDFVEVKAEEVTLPIPTVNIFDILDSVKDNKNMVLMEEPKTADTFPEYTVAEEIEEPEMTPIVRETSNENIFNEESIYNQQPEITEKVIPEGKTSITIDEVEELSRGKFLDYSIQSAISDAKMKGDKEIYITEEELEKLKQ